MDIRLLKADEIEVRVQSTSKTKTGAGCILLLYKDSRTDMRILDEIFGVTGWQRTHEVINGNLFCNIDIWDKTKGCWIRKQDVGVESNTEKEKGQASDSFKRAGFNIGIGRELYSSPFIWIALESTEWSEFNNKPKINAQIKFSVKSIGYNDKREIDSLEIEDNKGKVRYTLKAPTKPVSNPKPQATNTTPKAETKPVQPVSEQKAQTNSKVITVKQRERLFTIAKGNNEVIKMVMHDYGFTSTKEITMDKYEAICSDVTTALKEA